ncbi:YbjN domain-containing protein [Oceanimonas smirnovii]|uniref:YbjN domain-containing protein n=2 Tax=Aeromonadaceae TaxID=84642 RepID=A0ABW7NXN8_9GAMM|nr:MULTISPECIES: YbjN domain-containing protein [Oceanimonas]MDV2858594.1 YbjN domain-containing protein [Oceanimonas sp. CAM02]
MLTAEIAMRWLVAGHIDHYICENCHGIHLAELQELDGILESRLFVEHEDAIVTTEVEIRPTALLMLMADLGRLNMNYPSLKIFVDIVDDNLPRLIVANYLHTQAGIEQHQFQWIMQQTMMATHQLTQELGDLGYLMQDEPQKMPAAVH